MEIPYEYNTDQTVKFILITLGTNAAQEERMNPFDFGGQRSRSQYTTVEIT